jgi:signal transduction histidine kinase
MRIKRWFVIFAVLAAMGGAFVLCGWLARNLGVGWLRYLITGFGGLAAMFAAGSIWRLTHSDAMEIMNQHNVIIEAIDRISHGDFDVFVPPNEHAPHNEMAMKFNEMVKSLGDLEQMRQDFISNVSHEIQSPLTSIKGFAVLLQNADLPPDERQKYARIIEDESRRLSSLSDNLLKLSALDGNAKPLNMAEYRLDKQIQSVVLSLEPQWAARNIDIEIDLPKTAVIADEALLSGVWLNLIHNAVKFTKDSIRILLAGDSVIIEDNGAGISPGDLPHIFERFYKADKARDRSLGGNGLGLALVKKILDLHDFSIVCLSETGKGTKFKVTLVKK